MKRLFDLDPNEVSLVPRGANKKKFLIFKEHKGRTMPQSEIQQLINSVDPKTMARIDKVLKTMGMEGKGNPGKKQKVKGNEGKPGGGDMPPKKDSATFKDAGADHQVTDEGTSHDHKPLSDRAQAALKATARILAPFKDEITDDHLDAIQQEIGMPMDEETPSDDDEGPGKIEMSMDAPDGVKPEDHEAAMGESKKAYMDHMKKMGYRQHPDPSTDETNATKSADDGGEDDNEEEESVGKVVKSALDLSAFPKEQRSQLEQVFKAAHAVSEQNKELVKKNADLEKEIRQERDIRLTREFEDRAKNFKHLGANTTELAKVMKSLSETSPDALSKFESVLKGANEQLRVVKAFNTESVFDEIGTKAGGGGSNAGEQLETLVDSVVAKSDGKSREQVYEEVLKTKDGKRLYAEYKASRRHGA